MCALPIYDRAREARGGAGAVPVPSPQLRPCAGRFALCRAVRQDVFRQDRRQPLASAGKTHERQDRAAPGPELFRPRSEEHTSELQSLMRISYAVFCLTKKKNVESP